MPPPHGLRESDYASRPHHLPPHRCFAGDGINGDRVATMPSCISPEVPVRRRPSFSATRLWRATALGPGAISSWQIGVALAVQTRSSVSSTVRRSNRRPTSTRFSRSRRCARAVPPRTDLGPVAMHDRCLSGGSRGDQGRVEMLAAHAGRRVVRTRLAMQMPQAIQFARPWSCSKVR